jgi:hypothetical protein
MVKIRTILWFSLLLLWLVPSLALAARVRAVADRDRMTLGESLRLELRIEGSADGGPDLSALEQDWEIVSRAQNSQLSIVNGDFKRSLVYSLTLMPRREGAVAIPAVCFGADCSLPLPIRVTAAADNSAAEDAKLLLEAEIDADQVVSQGQLLLKVRLLRRVDLLQGALTEPEPTGVDAVLQKLGEDRKYEIRRAGRLYGVIERQYAIFPQAAGTLRIPPLRFDGVIVHGRQGERVRLFSQPLQVEVLPPAGDLGGRPWLPARSLRLQDDWQGRQMKLTVGEPATRTLTLTAEGLQAAQLPPLQPGTPAGFKSYPDQPSRKDEFGRAGITGILQQKIALVPTRPGRYRLPAIDLDWWDIAAGQWQQVHLDPVTIEVGPATGTAAAAPTAGLSPNGPQPPTEEVPAAGSAPVSPEAPAPQTGTTAAAPANFWPWLSLVLGLGWLATLVLLWRQRANRPRQKSAQPEDSPRQKEKTARQAVVQAARANDPRAARQALAAWIRTLWPEADRPDLERLRRTAPDALRAELDRLDRALYAPAGEHWTGEALIEALRQWQLPQRARGASENLPDLYPSD